MPEITSAADIQTMQQYIALRDAPRLTMAHGVYPNSVKALAEYQMLLEWLYVKTNYGQLHANTTANVALYVAQLQQAMQSIITIMQAIEAAAPGTFGIELPVEEQSE